MKQSFYFTVYVVHYLVVRHPVNLPPESIITSKTLSMNLNNNSIENHATIIPSPNLKPDLNGCFNIKFNSLSMISPYLSQSPNSTDVSVFSFTTISDLKSNIAGGNTIKGSPS